VLEVGNPRKDSCWVSYRLEMLLEFFRSNKGLKNLILIESDQLFFKDMNVLSTRTCKGASIGFTFHLSKPHQIHCLNSGLIWIKVVDDTLIAFFEKVHLYLEEIVKAKGCMGGMEQEAICHFTGKSGEWKQGSKFFLKRYIQFDESVGIKTCSIPMERFNSKRVGCTPKGPMKNSYLSHFVGSRKKIMLRQECMRDFKEMFPRLANNPVC
jgi:hypothetical protein